MTDPVQAALNKGIRDAIDNFDLYQAQKNLDLALKLNPDAETYYLASMLEVSEEKKRYFLEKSLDEDPFYEEAFAEMERLKSESMKTKERKRKKNNRWWESFRAAGTIGLALGLAGFVLSGWILLVGLGVAMVTTAILTWLFNSMLAGKEDFEAAIDYAGVQYKEDSILVKATNKVVNATNSTAGKITSAVTAATFAVTAITSFGTSGVSDAFQCVVEPKGVSRNQIELDQLESYDFQIAQEGCWTFDEWVEIVAQREQDTAQKLDRYEVQTEEEIKENICSSYSSMVKMYTIKSQRINGNMFYITGDFRDFRAIHADNFRKNCGYSPK